MSCFLMIPSCALLVYCEKEPHFLNCWIVPSTATMLFESEYKSSSSSSRIGYTYDFFWVLEEKIIKNFTDHLYIALLQAWIHTFQDDNELPKGEDILHNSLRQFRSRGFHTDLLRKPCFLHMVSWWTRKDYGLKKYKRADCVSCILWYWYVQCSKTETEFCHVKGLYNILGFKD
jgi:hypothetical protein